MTFAEEMIAYSEAQAAIEAERQRWAAEKAISRLDTPDDMRWILGQASNNYATAEALLAVWDELRMHSVGLAVSIVRKMGALRRMEPTSGLTKKFMSPGMFIFDPSYKILFATSHKPETKIDDKGIWRRILASRPIQLSIRSDAGDLALRLAMYIALKRVP